MLKTREITERNLKNHVGKSLWIEREGIVGNFFTQGLDGKVIAKEGELFGVLCKDEKGFYVKMFKTKWDKGYGIRIYKQKFLDEVYRLQNGDIIHLYSGERIVRLSQLETS